MLPVPWLVRSLEGDGLSLLGLRREVDPPCQDEGYGLDADPGAEGTS